MTKRQKELYEIIELNLTVRGSVHFESFQDNRRYVAPHWHDAIEIISVTHGNLMVNIDQKEFHLEGGDCIILPPYSIHSTLSTSGNSALLLQIPVDAFSECRESEEKRTIICDPFPSDAAGQKSLKHIRDLLGRIFELQKSRISGAGLVCAGLLMEIMYELYTGQSRPKDSFPDHTASFKNRQRLSAVMTYTEARYQENISLDDAAREVHLQANYFCRIFKENTGMTYLQYLNEYRLGRIYQDLMETDIPLKLLLEKHGFTNYKLFRRMFFERFGATPGELRRNAGNAAAAGDV
jgi:AraC-like DNA-binding protein/mannose-6-phosphate isomerase-like protein (cupin superfamily)